MLDLQRDVERRFAPNPPMCKVIAGVRRCPWHSLFGVLFSRTLQCDRTRGHLTPKTEDAMPTPRHTSPSTVFGVRSGSQNRVPKKCVFACFFLQGWANTWATHPTGKDWRTAARTQGKWASCLAPGEGNPVTACSRRLQRIYIVCFGLQTHVMVP